MKQIEQKNGTPVSAGNTNTDSRRNEVITLATDDVEAFTEICGRIGYTIKIEELDSSMVEAFVDVDTMERRIYIKYAYLQGLRYGIAGALEELRNNGVIEIIETEWRVACNRDNCQHVSHYPEEPVRITISIKQGR